MPITQCLQCGRTTNSETSNYWLDIELDGVTQKEIGVATHCYAAFVAGLWLKGCLYNETSQENRDLVANLLLNEGA